MGKYRSREVRRSWWTSRRSREREGERKREVTYHVEAGKTRGPETRTEMSMAPYATCLCANKFLVRVPNRGVGIRRVSGPYAKGDGDRTRSATNEFRAAASAGKRKGRRRTRSLFSILSRRICEYARSFPTASDIHEEYCNHVLEKKEKEEGKKKGANFGRKMPLCAAISRLFEKRPSGESVCMYEEYICMRETFKWLYRYFERLMSVYDLHGRTNIQHLNLHICISKFAFIKKCFCSSKRKRQDFYFFSNFIYY